MAFRSPHYELPSFARLISSVTRLHIAPNLGLLHDSRFRDPFIAFWEQVIQLDVLSLISHSLTSFVLHSNIDVGIVPRLDFSQVNLPALRSLSLEKILFNEETHIEDFIVRHKKTEEIVAHGVQNRGGQRGAKRTTQVVSNLGALRRRIEGISAT